MNARARPREDPRERRGDSPSRGVRVPWGLLLILATVPILIAVLPRATALGYALRPLAVGGEAGGPSTSTGLSAVAGTPAEASELADLAREAEALERELAGLEPRGPYIVIDRGNNRLWVRDGEEVVVEAVVSTGSRAVLQEAGGQERRWTFDTPPGRHRVLGRRANPVWVKPDWAFLEEGQQPPDDIGERMEKGTLGEWALDLGDGYMIHGTLYERLLGRSITHGCIRVGRDDLRAVVAAAPPGTPVLIY